MKLVHIFLCIIAATSISCKSIDSCQSLQNTRTEILGDLFRSEGNTYKIKMWGFDMPDEDFALLDLNFKQQPPPFEYKQEKTPTGDETVTSIKSIMIRSRKAHATLFFTAHHTFYEMRYTLYKHRN